MSTSAPEPQPTTAPLAFAPALDPGIPPTPGAGDEGSSASAVQLALELAAERAARATTEAALRRASFIADVTATLLDSLDYERRLRDLAHAVVPTLGDWCAIDVVTADGGFRRIAVAHPDPAKVALARTLEARYPEDPTSPTSRAQVLARGTPVCVPEITDAMIDAGARDAEHARLIRALALRAYVVAPLVARGRPLGTITVVAAESGRTYGAEDVELVAELARRVGMLIENGRLHSELQGQRALLEEQAVELELQQTQLHDAMAELEVAHETLQAQAEELETTNARLREAQATLEAQGEELARRNAALEHANAALASASQVLAAERADAEDARQRITTIVESIGDGFFALDHAWRFTYLNARAVAIMSRPREELLGRVLWDAYPGVEATEFGRRYREAAATGESVRFEAYYAPRDRWYEVAVYPSADGLSVFFQNVTERRRTEDALRDREARWHTLAEAMPQLVWTCRADGWSDFSNQRWLDYTGQRQEETWGLGWMDVMHPDDRQPTLDAWQPAVARGEPFESYYRLRRASDGAYRWFLARAVPQRDAEGRITRWFGTCTDVHDQRTLEEERTRLLASERQARAEAEAANRAKAEFLAMMSHELRTPLNAIGGYVELLELGIRGPVTDQQRADLARVQRAQRHLLGVITDILNFARLEQGQVELRPRAVSVAAALDGVEAILAPQIAARGLAFHVDRGDATLAVHADPERLGQILLNLAQNAAKFTAAGRIAVRAEALDDARVAIRVEDTGRGIAPERLVAIFEPFVQIDRHRTAPTDQGLGLGLPISRELARAMGGELSAESAPGIGSTFTLTLPRAPAA